MPFSRTGIEDVRACILPDAVTADGRPIGLSRSALVVWRSDLEAKLYQVYINGHLAGVTLDPQQREMAVQTPSSFDAAVAIIVGAVEPEEAHLDFSAQIGQSSYHSTRVRLTLLRSQDLPVGAMLDIYSDQGTGPIDYDAPLNETPIAIWSCWQDKAGFGLSCFGESDHGWDAAAAVGFGKGCFGRGHFGLDADVIEWISPVLPQGTYRFGIRVIDEVGNASMAVETPPLTIVPPARPVAELSLASFDEQSGELTLNVVDQP